MKHEKKYEIMGLLDDRIYEEVLQKREELTRGSVHRPARVLVILDLHRLEQRTTPIGGHGDPLTLPASELQQNEPFTQPLFGLYRNRIILGRRDACCVKITSHTQPLYLHDGGILHPLRVGEGRSRALALGRGGRVHTGI